MGMPGKCRARTRRRKGSSSHWKATRCPARSSPRSNPPTPLKREPTVRLAVSPIRLPELLDCALAGAVGDGDLAAAGVPPLRAYALLVRALFALVALLRLGQRRGLPHVAWLRGGRGEDHACVHRNSLVEVAGP